MHFSCNGQSTFPGGIRRNSSTVNEGSKIQHLTFRCRARFLTNSSRETRTRGQDDYELVENLHFVLELWWMRRLHFPSILRRGLQLSRRRTQTAHDRRIQRAYCGLHFRIRTSKFYKVLFNVSSKAAANWNPGLPFPLFEEEAFRLRFSKWSAIGEECLRNLSEKGEEVSVCWHFSKSRRVYLKAK